MNELDEGSGDIFFNDNEFEPDMSGVEENVDTKADQMHEGRGRVRTSSQIFLQHDIATRIKDSKNNTDTDIKRTIALVQALEFRSLAENE